MTARRFLPFLPEFHEAIRGGRKTVTTRSEAYGAAGEIVDSPVGPLRLLEVRPERLHVVAHDHWREEGVESPEAFIAIWNRLHPRRGFEPDALRVLHRFEVVR